jgi:hypothetical protein
MKTIISKFKTMKANQTTNKKLSIYNLQFTILMMLLAASLIACGNKTKTGEATTGEAKPAATGDQKAMTDKRLPFERGSYVEESNMMGMNVKKTVYFDKWGDWTASETKMEMTILGHTAKTDKLEIVKGTTHWDLDLVEKTGKTYESAVLPTGMAAALGAAIGGKMTEGMEIKELGEEDYLGYQCKKTQVKYAQMAMDVTTLAYGNLTMKMEGKMGKSDISVKITSIDLSAPPASIFEVPADIQVTKN